mmetsp:Transcript_56886/g.166578  ORF Transcript_56886/g.166578 Transcript_56886/m.166578 type:complete len:259 (-) Transcript_56886:628-1404(-)
MQCLVQVTLCSLWRTDTHELAHGNHQRKRHREGVHGRQSRAQKLDSELARRPRRRARVHGVLRKHAQQDGPDKAAHAVHAPDVQGVVQVELLKDEDAVVADHSGNEAQDEGAPEGHVARARRDGGEAGDRADAGANEAGLLTPQAVNQEPEYHPRRARQLRVHCRCNRDSVAGDCRPRIEAKPAKPQHGSAQCHEGDVVWLLVDGVVMGDVPTANDHQRGKGGEPRGNVHHDAPGKVKDAPLLHEATTPDPVADRRID